MELNPKRKNKKDHLQTHFVFNFGLTTAILFTHLTENDE